MNLMTIQVTIIGRYRFVLVLDRGSFRPLLRKSTKPNLNSARNVFPLK